MSAYQKITAAMFGLLALSADALPDIAWPNRKFVPMAEEPYIKPTMLIAEPSQIELGEQGQNYLRGILQVSCFAPADGRGDGVVNGIAAQIIELYKRGTILTADGQSVICDRAWPGPAIDEDDWLHVPVSVAWHAYANN